MRIIFPKLCLLALALLPLQYIYAESTTNIEQQYLDAAEEPGAILFTPPRNWRVADPKMLPPRVKVMVIGKGQNDFPPSINLGMESYKGTVKDYLKTVKALNDSQGATWKDLGTIRTQAGDASLSQVDMKSEWGDVRLMHVILKKEDTLYVLTAASLKEEFPEFYKEFFTTMRSLRFNKSAYDMIPSAKRRKELQTSEERLKSDWEKLYATALENAKAAENPTEDIGSSVFNSLEFQKQYWEPFQAMLARNFADMSTIWHKHVAQKIKNELLISTMEDKKN